MDDVSTTATDSPEKPLSTSEFLSVMAARLGPSYRVISDGWFHWATPFADDQHAHYAAQAAYALRRVAQTIPGLIMTPPEHGWPALLFASVDAQLAYEAFFPGSGNRIISGGSWCSWPIGHLAIPVSAWDSLAAAFGHELVHAALSGTGVPGWLQEGLATELETGMGNRTAPLNDLYHWRETLAWWRSHPADTFWNGSAFGDPASSRYAYALAQVLALRLTGRPDLLERACTLGTEAWKDQDSALRTLVGGDREQLFQAVTGDGPRRGWLERFLYWCFVGDRP